MSEVKTIQSATEGNLDARTSEFEDVLDDLVWEEREKIGRRGLSGKI